MKLPIHSRGYRTTVPVRSHALLAQALSYTRSRRYSSSLAYVTLCLAEARYRIAHAMSR